MIGGLPYLLSIGALIGAICPGWAQFEPPRIVSVMHRYNSGDLLDSLAVERAYYLDKGIDSNIKQGDELKVYRAVTFKGTGQPALLVSIGTMKIRITQQGAAIGTFEPKIGIDDLPGVEYKTAMIGDLVAPRLVVEARLLFDSGKADFKQGATAELDKVAGFIGVFLPSQLVVEGHSDSDGKPETNQQLSELRAQVVRGYLVNQFDFIKANTVRAVGYGETQPVAENTSEINKQLNRRIEFVVLD